MPESFKVLVKELQSLCLDIRVLDENGEVVDLAGIGEDDTPAFNTIEEVEHSVDSATDKKEEEDEGETYSDDGDEALDDELFDEEFDSDEEYAFEDDYADEEE